MDGYSHHFEQQWKKDSQRQKELEEAGFTILRFSDDEVMNDIRNVERVIVDKIKKLEERKSPLEGGKNLRSRVRGMMMSFDTTKTLRS